MQGIVLAHFGLSQRERYPLNESQWTESTYEVEEMTL